MDSNAIPGFMLSLMLILMECYLKTVMRPRSLPGTKGADVALLGSKPTAKWNPHESQHGDLLKAQEVSQKPP